MSLLDQFGRRVWQGTKARKLRRAYPIHAYIGPNGGGKSAAAVWDSLPSLERGRPVLATVRLLDYKNPRLCDDGACTSEDHAEHMAAHPLWRPLNDWQALLDAEHCDVIADEVTGVASSRESQGMPAAVANLLVQLRRRDVVLRWTAPSWPRADTIIRECSQAVTHCQGYLAVDAQSDDGDEERLWRKRRLFRWRTFDAAAFDEWSTGKAEQLKPWASEWFWGPSSEVFDAYDTYDAVMTIGHVLDSGRCAHCGGRRRAAECSCHDYQAGKTKSARVRGGSPEGSPGASAPVPLTLVGHAHDSECESDPANARL